MVSIESCKPGNGTMDLRRFSGDPDFMLSFAKGLAALEAFDSRMDSPTLAEISAVTRLSCAAVRRCLYTLSQLGYASTTDGGGYTVNARLSTGSYTNGLRAGLGRAAQPILDSIQRAPFVCYSVTILEEDKVVCIARTPTDSLNGISRFLDDPLPAYCTAMGRLLIASLSPASMEHYLRSVVITPFTGRTIKSVERLRIVLRNIQRCGYASCDQEYALGFRSAAVPIHSRRGKVVASLNASTFSNNARVHDRDAFLVDKLRDAAAKFLVCK